MDRLISKKEVLKAIENAMIFADWRDNKYDAFCKLEVDVKDIPPADEDEWVKRSDVLRVIDKRVDERLSEPFKE